MDLAGRLAASGHDTEGALILLRTFLELLELHRQRLRQLSR
jgi:hypothetical protein